MISLSLSLSVCLARRRHPFPSSFRPCLSKLTSPATARRLFLTLSLSRPYEPSFALSFHFYRSLIILRSLSPLKRLSPLFSRIRALSFSLSRFYALFLVGSAWSHSYFPLLKPSLFFLFPSPLPLPVHRAALLSRLFSRSLHLPLLFCPAIVCLSLSLSPRPTRALARSLFTLGWGTPASGSTEGYPGR